jgi:hypothetical protein
MFESPGLQQHFARDEIEQFQPLGFYTNITYVLLPEP